MLYNDYFQWHSRDRMPYSSKAGKSFTRTVIHSNRTVKDNKVLQGLQFTACGVCCIENFQVFIVNKSLLFG